MAGTAALIKTLTLPSIIALLLAGTTAHANGRTTSEYERRLNEARSLVNEYRELRRVCAGQTGENRRSCFHELRTSNNDYRSAKQQLGLMDSADPDNIHLVTF